jgi:aspartate/methionine/tyrosine aminotransferase
MINVAGRVNEIKPFRVMEILAQARALERQGADIVHLEIGEPDFPTPRRVVEAAVRYVQHGYVTYTPAGGLPELRAAIAAYYGKRYGVPLDPERVFVTPGASGAFLLALGMVLQPGQGVALADPGYPCYGNFVHLFGGNPVFVPVDERTNYHLSPQLLQACWDKNVGGAIISSPGNPTGTLMASQVLNGLAELVDQRAGFLISDEIYHGLEYGPPCRSALEFSSRTLIVNSFSKYFGMTGWRLGWLVVPENLIAAAEKLAQNIFISAPAHSQVAAVAAFSEENLKELEERKRVFQERRDFLCRGLQEIGFVLKARPEGAFYVYADCSHLSLDSYSLALRLLNEVGVAVTPGLDFGLNRPQCHLRFCYTVAVNRLAEGLRRMGDFARNVTKDVHS